MGEIMSTLKHPISSSSIFVFLFLPLPIMIYFLGLYFIFMHTNIQSSFLITFLPYIPVGFYLGFLCFLDRDPWRYEVKRSDNNPSTPPQHPYFLNPMINAYMQSPTPIINTDPRISLGSLGVEFETLKSRTNDLEIRMNKVEKEIEALEENKYVKTNRKTNVNNAIQTIEVNES